MIRLTELGKTDIDTYIRELEAKRKEILNAGKDTADYTELPKEEDIIADIDFFEENCEYCNNWGVTDNYDGDLPLYLKRGIHYEYC